MTGSLRLSVSVQHHPSRARLLDTLIPALGECDVITDPGADGTRSPIRCYLACLRSMPPWATHLLIVQDDARPCSDFRARAERAVEEKSTSLVALFLAGAPAKSARLAVQAHRRGEPWVLMHPSDWTPTVALCWTRAHRDAFLAYAGDNPSARGCGDDNLVGAFTTAEKVPVWATVPSLVEHPDVEPSLIGRKASGGANRFRVAAVPPSV